MNQFLFALVVASVASDPSTPVDPPPLPNFTTGYIHNQTMTSIGWRNLYYKNLVVEHCDDLVEGNWEGVFTNDYVVVFEHNNPNGFYRVREL